MTLEIFVCLCSGIGIGFQLRLITGFFDCLCQGLSLNFAGHGCDIRSFQRKVDVCRGNTCNPAKRFLYTRRASTASHTADTERVALFRHLETGAHNGMGNRANVGLACVKLDPRTFRCEIHVCCVDAGSTRQGLLQSCGASTAGHATDWDIQ